MAPSVRDWLMGRATVLAAALAASLGPRCSAPALPGRDVEAFAHFLGDAAGATVDAASIAWEPTRGWLGDLFSGRRALFVGYPEGQGTSDVFRARVRVSRDGQPLSVEAITNLTATPAGDETGLRVSGRRAAYAVFAGGLATGVTVLGLGEVLSRTHLHLPPVPRVAIAWQGARLALLRRNEATLRYDPESRSFEPADANVVLASQPPVPEDWQSTLTEILHEWVGPRAIEQAAARWFGAEAPHAATPSRSLQREPAATKSPWPPRDLPPLGPSAEDDEGRWRPLGVEWSEGAGDAPLFYGTFLRVGPRARVQLIAIDMRRLSLRMEGGYAAPHPEAGLPGVGRIPEGALGRVRASFNGVAERDGGRGGMVVGRRVLSPAVAGAATVAVLDSGAAAFGLWPPGPELQERVASLRQSPSRLVPFDAEAPSRQLPLQERLLIERSALCLAHDGQLHYALGRDLSARALASVLEHAGCAFALPLEATPGHSGFFLHHAANGSASEVLSATAVGPASRPDRFLRQSSQDFFYLMLADGSERSDHDWLPSPGAQPEPEWLPAITSTRHRVGSLEVEVVRLGHDRLRFGIAAGSAEPLIAGRPAPRRTVPPSEPVLFALNLGHTTVATRYGLAFQAEATLPLRRAYATLLVADGTLRIASSGSDVEVAEGEEAVQLPQLLAEGELLPRAREAGPLRRRGALCVSADGHVLVARARHDSSDVLALTLRTFGCTEAVELDRGSQHDVFLERAGTPEAPRQRYETSVLFGTALPLAPRTRAW